MGNIIGTTGDGQSQSFAASTQMLEQVCAFVETWSAAAGLPSATALRLRLLAEELFLNAVVHGYRGAAGEVRLTLAASDGEAELTVEDQAEAFDPFANGVAVSASVDPFERPVGKLGLPLLLQMSSRHCYQRVDGRNCISISVAIARQA